MAYSFRVFHSFSWLFIWCDWVHPMHSFIFCFISSTADNESLTAELLNLQQSHRQVKNDLLAKNNQLQQHEAQRQVLEKQVHESKTQQTSKVSYLVVLTKTWCLMQVWRLTIKVLVTVVSLHIYSHHFTISWRCKRTIESVKKSW